VAQGCAACQTPVDFGFGEGRCGVLEKLGMVVHGELL
jgi:hypothetical protein